MIKYSSFSSFLVIFSLPLNSLFLPTKIAANKKNVIKKDVIIENNVFIGNNVTILKGVVIGENSVIGSNSLVCKSVPNNVIASGNPVKVIREIWL